MGCADGEAPGRQTAIVTTDKCYIRPYTPADAAALSAAANHPDIARFMRNRFPDPYSLDDAKFFINLSLEQQPAVNFGIFACDDDSFVGGIGLMPYSDTEYRTWEIGYWIGKAYWGRGMATIAVGAFVRWAFQNFPDLLRIEAGVYGGNHGSMKVLERVGFTKEGIRRSAVCKRGIVMDNVIYGLLRQDIDELATNSGGLS